MQQSEIRQGTKELTTIPPHTYELMQKHLEADPELVKENNVGAHKHKNEGYQLFKDKYIKQVVVKANVKSEHPIILLSERMCGCINKENSLYSLCPLESRYGRGCLC